MWLSCPVGNYMPLLQRIRKHSHRSRALINLNGKHDILWIFDRGIFVGVPWAGLSILDMVEWFCSLGATKVFINLHITMWKNVH